jgi:uncharacterized repeat protein (TIGR02543 family)
MAISGSFNLSSNANKPWAGRIDYTLTDDAANNRTRVQVKLYAYKTESYSSGSNGAFFKPTIKIDGIPYEGTPYTTERSYVAAQEEIRHLHQSVDVYVNHDSTGYKSLTIYGKVYKDYVSSDGYPTGLDYTSITGSKTITLTDYKTSCTITYNANGGSGTISPQTVTDGDTVTLHPNNFTAPTYKVWTLTLDGNGGNDGSPTFKGNYFNKWRAGSTSGTAYAAGAPYTPSKDITMYAWWGTSYIWGTTTRDSIINEGYTVTFDANGGTCDTDYLTSEIITSYDFLGWGNRASNPTSTFESDVAYGQTSNYTAYAIWSSPITTNGSITLPTPTRNGYEFLGWSTDKSDTNGITGEYAPDKEGIVLYAIWKRMGNVYIYDNAGGFNPYQVLIYDDSGWNQYIPYIYTESGWEVYSG